ncbi:MAG: polyprenyl diphosphate synthase, partial [Elusimicrobiota bacterium]
MDIAKELFDKIDKKKLPLHIAVIMDGNGRWAKKRRLPRVFGHKAGAKTVKEIIKAADNIGIKYLSLYALSTENWLARPVLEVKALMNILYDYLKQISELKENEFRLVITGDTSKFPDRIQEEIRKSQKYTAG